MTQTSTENRPRHSRWHAFAEFFTDRFNLEEDKAQRDEVVENISKGVVFRGVNLWILIFATIIASLGLNVNSAAVIIGAMLVSPLMGPIMGIGLSLGINDFDLLKKALRNFGLMIAVSIIASTLYFFISPLSDARSELLARTVPTTYDVLIAFFGGMAGMIAQTRKDRNSTVIPGVAIATALMPPLCTAGFGLATGQFRFFIGAFYLFCINTVFIALATYIMVRFLKYEKKIYIDKQRERYVRRIIMTVTLITFIPSVIIGFHMVRVSIFEATADKFVAQAFRFANTRVIECKKSYRSLPGKQSQIELLLLGEQLPESSIDNARAQMESFGLHNTVLTVHQSGDFEHESSSDIYSLQQGYSELLAEKNRQISRLTSQLDHLSDSYFNSEEIAGELLAITDGVSKITLSKSRDYTATDTVKADTSIVCILTGDGQTLPPDTARISKWLKVRCRVDHIKIYLEDFKDNTPKQWSGKQS